MSERCIDASVAIKWVVSAEPDRDKALELLKNSVAEGITLISPPLFAPEVDSYIRQRVHNGSLTPEEGKQAYSELDAVPVQILEREGVRQRAGEIAEQFNQRLCYDSVYAALAELRGCELWTADTRFYRVVKNDLPFVKHLADYL